MTNKISSAETNGVARRRTRTTHSKLERILLLVVFTSAIMVVFVNISLLSKWSITGSDDHHSVTNIHSVTYSHSTARNGSNINNYDDKNDAKKPTQQQQQNPQTNNVRTDHGADQGRTNKKQAYTVDEKMMRILRHVGIQNASQLSEDDRKLLPTWDEVVDRVGNNGPRILGLETCKAYRAAVTTDKRLLGVAGPFNSGTHYLDEVLSKNCMYKRPNKPVKKHNEGVMDQVPWGKHQSPRFRLIHSRDLGSSISRENDKVKAANNGILDHPELPPDLEEINRNVLPIVMVRDPFTWWQSMCKARYSAHWYHIVPDHCPNFIANHIEKEWFFKKRAEVRKHYEGDPWKVDNVVEKANYTLDKEVIPLWVRYHSENWQHKSLAHMWTDWYKDYYDAEYPRLMIRLEDLVFYPHETLRQVCECAIGGDDTTNAGDGYFEYIGDESLILSLDSAIKGGDNIHGKDRVGLLGAMAKHAGPFSVSHRATGMTKEDLEFATNVLRESETMSFFGYKIPLESHLEQNRNNGA